MAVAEKSVRDSVCLNHPNRQAATRCEVCFKPICEECTIPAGENVFCSHACMSKFERTRENVDQWHAQSDRARRRRLRRWLVRLIILAILAGAAYWFFTRNPDRLDELRDKAGSAVNQVKGGVRR